MKREPDYENMSVFDQIREGLSESIAHIRGRLTLKTTALPAPAPRLSKTRVVAIRKKAGMSQAVLAAYLNVPKRTLESWEQGLRSPKAGEARLLQMVEASPDSFRAMVSGLNPPSGRARSRQSRARRGRRVAAPGNGPASA